MPILLNHQLREQIPRDPAVFPVSFFRDELAGLPDRAGPVHWHPDFEMATAESGVLDFQVGRQHITLAAGDSIFVNGNMLHGVRQLAGQDPDPMPNIVFPGAVIAPETGVICQKYIRPIAGCETLPFVVFTQETGWHRQVNRLLGDIYRKMQEKAPCYEMAVQRALGQIFEFMFLHFEELPRAAASRVGVDPQVRLQKMLSYIYGHYAEAVTLAEIAGAASISRSEAERCFQAYMGCSPVEALIDYRLKTAYSLLRDSALTLEQIGSACGFRSQSYFSRRFRQAYGCAPGRIRDLGK